MRIIITGASGYLASALAKRLSQKGHELYLQTRSASKPLQETTKNIIQGDIRDSTVVTELAKIKADCAIYTVSLDHRESESDFAKVLDVSVRPLENFLRACGKDLKRIIYFSTVQVYGRELEGSISENNAPNPGNMYGLTHLFCEQICNLYRKRNGIEAINLRFSNIFGAPSSPNKGCWTLVINDLCKQAFLNKKIILQSDGSPVRDFLPLSDFLEAMSFFTDYEKSEHFVYNVASGNSITILEAAQIVSTIVEKKLSINAPVLYGGKDLRQNSAPKTNFSFDNSRLKSTGFRLNKSLEYEIENLFDHLENQCPK
jgi:UDP-glucose 4-epimerase